MKEHCYICDNVATERDHFPVPACMGGESTQPICRGCHDETDRTLLADWHLQRSFEALAAVWANSTVRERLMIAKLIKIAAHAVHTSRTARAGNISK